MSLWGKYQPGNIAKANEEICFDKLKAQEAAGGFKRRTPKSKLFRSGSKGNWERVNACPGRKHYSEPQRGGAQV